MFDGEQGTALHAMQGTRASPGSEGKSHGFSRVAVGTWAIFSSYSRDGPSKLMFVQQRQDSCLITRDTSQISLRLGRAIGMLLEVRRGPRVPFQLPHGYWDSYQFSRGVRHCHLLKH